MSDKKIRTMVTAAVLAALSCVATMVVQIPSPMNGFVNLGDCFVLLSGWLLGPWWGAAAGGIGSMLADLLLGYGHYAPGTLIIKGAMALVAALVFKAFRKNTAGALIGGVAAEVVMVAGYFGYAALLLGKGIGAAASVPGNLVQGAVGLVAGFLLLQVARRTHLEEKSACDILYGEPQGGSPYSMGMRCFSWQVSCMMWRTGVYWTRYGSRPRLRQESWQRRRTCAGGRSWWWDAAPAR